jgi:hypothetical protein
MSDAVRSILKKVCSNGGSLLDYREQLDPGGNFEVSARDGASKKALEEEFMEYLSITYGIELEEFQ